MILIDSNIPMYLVGAAHPHKLDAQRLLESALSAGERLVTDAEVLQEICHRYTAIDRCDAIQPTFDAILGVVDDVLSIQREDVEGAKDMLLRHAAALLSSLRTRRLSRSGDATQRHRPHHDLRQWVRRPPGDRKAALRPERPPPSKPLRLRSQPQGLLGL